MRVRSESKFSWLAAGLLLAALGPSILRAQEWVPKGPAPGLQGSGSASTENLPGNPFSGALEAVVAHPTNPNILWVGSVNGGIFRTDNATSPSPNWTPQIDGKGSLSIGALERDPTDGSHNTLVAGIAFQSSFGDDIGGVRTGLLRTTNGGAGWTSLPNLAGKNISGLAPRGSTIVAAASGPGSSCATVGIWRSTNTGASFTQISNSAGLTCGFTLDLASDPTNNNRLFAPVTGAFPVNSASGLYRSTNAGATWTEVGAGSVMDAALESNPKEVQVTVGKAGGANANIFVAVCDQNKLSGLFHSDDVGNTWASLDIPFTTELGTQYGIHPGGQCGTHLSLAADPTDPHIVYIGGDRQPANNENGGMGAQFPNSIGSNTYSGRLFKVNASLAPGSQATPITHCKTALPGCKGSKRTASGTSPHADSREMAFDANGDLIETDDGGVYRHTNPKGTNGDWVPVIGNLQASEAHNTAYDTVSNILISGLQDNNVVEQMSPGSNAWGTVVGGDGGDVVVGLNDPGAGQSMRYSSSQNLGGARRLRYNANNVILDGFLLSLTPVGGSPAIVPQFVTPIAMNATDPTRLIFGGVNGVYESFDRGASITRIANERIGTGGAKSGIAYGIASNPDALYYGVGPFVYFRLGAPPGSVPAIRSPSSGFDDDTITDVVMDPAFASTALAVDKDSIYATNEPVFGSWVNITGDLFTANPTAGEINTVEFFSSGGAYRAVVGTNKGVYQSTQASNFTSWSPLGTGLPNALVYELAYDPQNDLLVASTMGRGVWTLSLTAGACPWERVFANTTLGTAQTRKAEGIIYLGPNLTINNATGVTMKAGEVISFGNNVTIDGTFTATLGSCP